MNARARGQAVLALDDLLVHHPDKAAQFAATAPWLLDQYRAAARHVEERLPAAAATAPGGTMTASTFGEAPGWVRLSLIDLVVGWGNGEGSVCAHQPHPNRPQPVVAAAWRPGLVVCGRCTHLIRIKPGSVADRTCDGCGTTGPALVPTTLAFGPLLYCLGVCEDCRWWDDTDTERTA